MNIVSSSIVFPQNKYNCAVKDNTLNQLKLNPLNKDSVSFTGRVDKIIEKVLNGQNVSTSEILKMLNNVADEVKNTAEGSHKTYTFDIDLDFSSFRQTSVDRRIVTVLLNKKEQPRYIIQELQKLLNLAGYKLDRSGKLIKYPKIDLSMQYSIPMAYSPYLYA